MKKRTELEKLLTDVLAENEPALGRADLLAQTLHQARRKRQRRVLLRGAMSVALLAALGVWLWPSAPLLRERASAGGVRLVATKPMPTGSFFKTQGGLTPSFDSAPSELVLVETRTPAPDWQAIDDQQLLTLVGRPAALVRADSGHAQLVFSNLEDRDGLLRQ